MAVGDVPVILSAYIEEVGWSGNVATLPDTQLLGLQGTKCRSKEGTGGGAEISFASNDYTHRSNRSRYSTAGDGGMRTRNASWVLCAAALGAQVLRGSTSLDLPTVMSRCPGSPAIKTPAEYGGRSFLPGTRSSFFSVASVAA